MSDYQQIPGAIRSFLATHARAWTVHTADLATTYAALCDETNQRLRRCTDYLRRGMTSAAIHLADCQPNLANAVRALQFPERSAWADLCVAHGMAPPPVLETECLDALGRLVEREKKLQPLLSRHRLLAIAKAPAAARLEVVRLLENEDADNPAWRDERTSLEAVRLSEIARETETALQNDDEQTIASLWEELTPSRWRLDIPADIQNSLREKIAERDIRATEAELIATASEIVAALAAKAPAKHLDSLISRWRQLLITPGVTIAASLAAQVEPALAWQNGESRRRKEMEEVKPLQQLAAAQAPTSPPSSGYRTSVVATVLTAVVLIAGAIGYYYRHYLHK